MLHARIRHRGAVEELPGDGVNVSVEPLEFGGQHVAILREHMPHLVVELVLDQVRRACLFVVERPAPAVHGGAQVLEVGRDVVDRPRLAVDAAQLLLEVHAHAGHQRFRGRVGRVVEHGVGGIEHLAEEIELLRQNLEGQLLRQVALGQEADHGDAVLLAVAMHPADPLLDTLRIPRQVVVDHRVAELKVQPLGASFGRDEHPRPRGELVHQRQASRHLRAGTTRRRDRLAYLGFPLLQGSVNVRTAVVAAKQRDVLRLKRMLEQQPSQVVLRGERLGEHYRFARFAGITLLVADDPERVEQLLRLAVVAERRRPGRKRLHDQEFCPHAVVALRHWFGRYGC